MAATVPGTVFNIQRFSLHDGPGIRTTVFLKGCPLDCAWCHNPEGRSSAQEMRVVGGRCVDCGHCVDVCPQHSAQPAVATPRSLCTLCGSCTTACPTGAREIVGREMTVAEVVAAVLRDRLFLDQSQGGVTLSGGEPLAQAEFSLAVLTALRAESIHTALDTCGYAARDVLLAVADAADLVLYDIKAIDDVVHRQYTGVSNVRILSNLETLAAMHQRIWVRIPLVREVNTDRDSLQDMARFVASLPHVEQVNLLPYHRLGTEKMLTGRSTSRPTGTVGAETIDAAAAVFRAAGILTIVGG